jgi:ParB-like chromosome segregation protein Spo0J
MHVANDGNEAFLPAPLHNFGPMEWPAERSERSVVLVSVDSLTPGESPRLEGIDITYAEALANLESDLPPIFVQRSSMRVIDGMHRLQAARLSGRHKIHACFLDCDEDEAFLLAVAANTAHGLPLTIDEKRAAVAHIIRIRPDASDRWIAQISGLSAATVAAVRQANTETIPSSDRRLGRDGRLRPLNATDGRRLARDLLASNPDASLRQIAREAGISVGTVRDVRKKIQLGIDPVQTKRPMSRKPGERDRIKVREGSGQVDPGPILQRLQRDPALRYTEPGRLFLRWLSPKLLRASDWEGIVDSIPAHWVSELARIAYSCAATWAAFAEELENRKRKLT